MYVFQLLLKNDGNHLLSSPLLPILFNQFFCKIDENPLCRALPPQHMWEGEHLLTSVLIPYSTLIKNRSKSSQPASWGKVGNKDWIRNMHRKEMEAQLRISNIFEYELNEEYVLGWKDAPESIFTN